MEKTKEVHEGYGLRDSKEEGQDSKPGTSELI